MRMVRLLNRTKFDQLDIATPRTAVIFDLDDTIADTEHRRHWVPDIAGIPKYDRMERDKYWKKFHDLAVQDPPISATIEIMKRLRQVSYFTIIIMTARIGTYKEVTQDWLRRNDVPWDILYMRADHDKISGGTALKEMETRELLQNNWTILAAWDDHINICRMYRRLGIVAYQTGERND